MMSLIPMREQLPRVSPRWLLTRDGDEYCYAMARRHYSARQYREQRQRLFIGPGRKIVLLSEDGLALFAWRDDCVPTQTGYNCCIFRNEGPQLSSELIREAVGVVWQRWGVARCYTLVDERRIRSVNPGCCFIKAGWRRCGKSKGGKVILELEGAVL